MLACLITSAQYSLCHVILVVELFRRNRQHSCVASIVENKRAHITQTHAHPLENKETNDNFREDLIEIARTLVIALKLSSIKFNFSSTPYMQPTTLAVGFVCVWFLVWFGLISCQEEYYFQFAYFFVLLLFPFSYNIFLSTFMCIENHQSNNTLQNNQQITYHSVHGIELNDFWTLPNKRII